MKKKKKKRCRNEYLYIFAKGNNLNGKETLTVNTELI